MRPWTDFKLQWLVAICGLTLSASALSEPLVEVDADPGLFLREVKTVRSAKTISGPALTVEIAFVPENDALLPSVKPNGSACALFNHGSGYHSGFRVMLTRCPGGVFAPTLQIGRSHGGGATAVCNSVVVPGETNYVAVAWNGASAHFRVNGEDCGATPLVANWLSPEDANEFTMGFTGWGLDPVPLRIVFARVWGEMLTAEELAARDVYADWTKLPSALRLAHFVSGVYAERDDFSLAALRSAFRDAQVSPAFSNLVRRVEAEFLLREGRNEEAQIAFSRQEGVDDQPKAAIFARWGKAREAERDRRWTDAVMAYAALGADTSVPRHIARDARNQAARCRARAEGRPEIADGEEARHTVPVVGDSPVRFFVSPMGDDAAEGSEMRPFKTLIRARDAVRAFRAACQGRLPEGGVTVFLRGGRHAVRHTLELGPEDSGSPDAPVRWLAWGDERPVLDGGFEVPPLKVVTDADALMRIPESAHGRVLVADVSGADEELFRPFAPYGTHFHDPARLVTDLYCDGEPMIRARHPNADWLRVGRSTNQTFLTTLDLMRWTRDREPDLAAHGYWCRFWADATLPVVRVDAVTGELETDGRFGPFLRPKQGQTFRLVNALAAIDEPGEWFLDRATKKLYVYPRAAGGNYILSSFGRAFLVARGVKNLDVRGLVFENGRHDAVDVSQGEGFVFAGNVVRKFGGDGLRAFDLKNAIISGNVFHTFGHTAVEVSGGVRKSLMRGDVIVANNVFSDTGRAQRTYTPGIHAQGVGIDVVHNHFHDIPSSAMRFVGNDIYVAWNLVERVVTESDDQGGIDMWGDPSLADIEMSFNVWRDIGGAGEEGFPAGRAGIRLDDAISGMTIYGNRFINASKGIFGGVQVNKGRCNVIDNNLFSGGEFGVSFDACPRKAWCAYLEREDVRKWMYEDVDVSNEPYRSRYPHMGRISTIPMVNHVTRNAFGGCRQVFRGTPKETDIRANRFRENGEVAARSFDENPWMRPLPPLSSVGLYPDAWAERAKRNDR